MKSKKGFTLTELIVVIAIIAILSAILIPSITGYISKAREARIRATLKEYEKEQERQEILENIDNIDSIDNVGNEDSEGNENDEGNGGNEGAPIIQTTIEKDENVELISLYNINPSGVQQSQGSYFPGEPIQIKYPSPDSVAYLYTTSVEPNPFLDIDGLPITNTTDEYVFFSINVGQPILLNPVYIKVVFKEGENITGLAVIWYPPVIYSRTWYVLTQMTFPKTSSGEYQNVTDEYIEEIYNQAISKSPGYQQQEQ